MLDQYAILKVLQKVLSYPNSSFSIRGIASNIGISPGAARIAFDFLKEKGIVSLNIIGKTYQYRANLDSPLCRQWKILLNIDFLANSKIVENLVEKMQNIHSILLYGSFARGTNDEKSDIDLLVIAHNPVKTDFGFANKLKREVNLSIMSLNDWKKKAGKDKVFYENVIFDSIVLFGERPVVL